MVCLAKKYRLFSCAILLIMFLSEIARASEKFEPLFEGLAEGLGFVDECTSFKENSVRVRYQEMDYSFEAFLGPNCAPEKRLVNDRLPVYSMLAGEWQGLLVIDNGTGSNSRSLTLYDPHKKANIIELDYAERPVFGKSTIDFYVSTGIAEDATSCSDQKEEYEQWRRFQFAVVLTIKQRYFAGDNKVIALDDKKCVPIE